VDEDHVPVGVGKSHVARALAHLAVRAGAVARFMKTSCILALLAGGRADRTWDRRLAELARPASSSWTTSVCASSPPLRPTTSTSSSPNAPAND
jgi:IstB-like ATP binding protein